MGLTDQKILHKISSGQFEKNCQLIEKEVLKLNYQIASESNDQNSKLPIGRLRQTKSLDLVLLQHWSLYDSLMCSGSTIPVLRTWHE